MTLEKAEKPRSNFRYFALGGTVLAVMALWSGGWFFLKDKLQEEIGNRFAKLSEQGVQASCRDLSIAGFPFRFEVSCAPFLMDTATGLSLSLPGLRTVALVYNPWHVILEAEGPGHFSSLPLELEGTGSWITGRASARYSSSALKAADFSFEKPSWLVDGDGFVSEVSAEQLEFHLREVPGEAGDVEAFLSLDQATSPLAPFLPAPADLKVHAAIPGGAALLSGQPLSLTASDWNLPVKLHQLHISSGSLEIMATGDVSMDTDGFLTGALQVELTDIDGMAALAASLAPEDPSLASTIKGAATAFGHAQKQENGKQVVLLPLTLNKSRVSIGLIPLGTLPPLRP
ncbi:DUF2125 domain-containing protein [Roseibium litorale]|uniref:DUF2125 domain-containing protein n=1 Tax=Roseibium litorale TaxID=2803841 RepID=A0ABR9CLF9_9HYPH|nr:DUF2125 domain-containing protein [Roseibium litorale]MBD8891694.1 DUF2125 domain-containing protein [Roseibium litorale]